MPDPQAVLPDGDVTFAMVDVQGSTALLSRLGAETCSVMFGDLHELARACAGRHGGVVFKTEGDGAWLAFPAPEGALRAAVDLTERIACHQWPIDPRPRVRVALHRGRAVVRDGEYVSMGIHQLTRVGHGGHGDQVIVTDEVVRDLSAVPVPLTLLGVYWVRDFPDPVRIHQAATGVATDFPALDLPRADLTNLLHTEKVLIGRDDLLAEVEGMLAGSRLVTLVGPGGVGKTTTAVAIAHRAVARGIAFWLVNLGAVEDGPQARRQVLSVLAESIGVSGDTEAVLGRLGSREVTLLVDNCEQIWDAAAWLVGEVLTECPRVRVLATSREPLHLVDETVVDVDGLELPPVDADLARLSSCAAVSLFAARARAVAPSFAITEESATDVAVLCRALDGLPLALELAAARVRHRTPAEILDELQTYGDLASVQSGRAPRHSSLEATVEWSLSTCTDAERAVFRQLAVFAGDADAAALAAVAGMPVDNARAALDRLADRSLVRTVVTSERRYGLLATMRSVAVRQLREHEDYRPAALAHARWVLEMLGAEGALGATAAQRLAPDVAAALERFEDADLPSGLVARILSSGVGDMLRDPSLVHGVAQLLQDRPGATVRERAVGIVVENSTTRGGSDEVVSPDALRTVLDAARSAGDPYLLVRALTLVASAGSLTQTAAGPTTPEQWAVLDEAESLLPQVPAGNDALVARRSVLFARAVAAVRSGDLQSSRAVTLQNLALSMAMGGPASAAIDTANLAEIDEIEGDLAAAVAGYAKSARLLGARGSGATMTSPVHASLIARQAARLHDELGDFEAASEWYADGVLAARRSGFKVTLVEALVEAARSARRRDDRTAAEAYAQEAVRLDPAGPHAATALTILADAGARA